MEYDAEYIVKDVRGIILSKKRGEQIDVENADHVPSPVTREENIDKKWFHDFLQIFMTKGKNEKAPVPLEVDDGFLCRQHSEDETLIQILPPKSLRFCVLWRAHFITLAGNAGQSYMHRRPTRTFLFPHIFAYFDATVRKCTSCPNNRAPLIKKRSYCSRSRQPNVSNMLLPTSFRREIVDTFSSRTVLVRSHRSFRCVI